MSDWTRRPASEWPQDPYPGDRPGTSWRLVDSWVHALAWVDGEWIDTHTGEIVDLGDRTHVLAYGSNANPSKLLAEAEKVGGLDVVVLDATICGAQAVWSQGHRTKDDRRVATIVEKDGHSEPCPVLAVRTIALPKVDAWEGYVEGRPANPYYIRQPFWGTCTLERVPAASTPEHIGDVVVYVGGPKRRPLVHQGRHLPLSEFSHDDADGARSDD